MIHFYSAWIGTFIYTSNEFENPDGSRINRSMILAAREIEGRILWVVWKHDLSMISPRPANWKWACKHRARYFGFPFLRDIQPGTVVPEFLFYDDDGLLSTSEQYFEERGVNKEQTALDYQRRARRNSFKRAKKASRRIYQDGRITNADWATARSNTRRTPLRVISATTLDWRLVRDISIGPSVCHHT